MSESSDLERRAQARVGRVLEGKWLLERLIGFGGMAAVYAARHRNGARAALKVLHPELARDETLRARFLAEGYAANKVEHPGAVRVLDDDTVKEGEDAGSAFIVMELLEGESVLDRVKRLGGVLPESDVLAIAEEVLQVLSAAHQRGIVHRDLKPDNLFASRGDDGRERVKVLDFGIARLLESGERRTAVGATLGTPSYMAPEQARGQRDAVDGRSDLFALGATMFRLLSGRRVHDAPSAPEIMVKMATLPAPPLRSVLPDARPSVAAIVDRALRFERDARYRDADAMLADVRAARAGEPLPSASVPADAAPFAPAAGEPTLGPAPIGPRDATVTTVQPAGAPQSISLPPTAQHPAAVAAAPKRSSRAIFIGGLLAFVAVVGVALFFVLAPSGSASDASTSNKEIVPAKEEEKSDPPPSKSSGSDEPVPSPSEKEPNLKKASADAGATKGASKPKPASSSSASASTSGKASASSPPGLLVPTNLGKIKLPPK